MPFDVQLHPGRIFGCSNLNLVGNPVRVLRPSRRRVVGAQVRILSQLHSDCGQLGPGLVQAGRDQCTGVRVDGEPAVLVRLGVLADVLTAADDGYRGWCGSR